MRLQLSLHFSCEKMQKLIFWFCVAINLGRMQVAIVFTCQYDRSREIVGEKMHKNCEAVSDRGDKEFME